MALMLLTSKGIISACQKCIGFSTRSKSKTKEIMTSGKAKSGRCRTALRRHFCEKWVMWVRSSQMEKVLRSGFYTAYMSAGVCRRGSHSHQQFYKVTLLLNFFHYKYFKKERSNFGLNKVCSTTQSNILVFLVNANKKTDISSMD